MKKKLIITTILLSLFILAFQTSPYARRIRPFSSTPSSCQENEIGYNMSSHSLIICTNSGYVALATGGSGGTAAPSDATYITRTANSSLSAEFALGSLATGILKNTTTTGTPTIAVAGTDYENPLTFTASDFDRTVNTISIDYTNGQTATSSLKGFLTSTDWSTFNGKESTLTFNSPLSRSTNTISCSTCGLTSNPLSQFASTTSAQLFGIISDESGAAGVLMRGNFTSLTANDILSWNGTNWINGALSTVPLPVGGNINMTIANASSTGTTINRLAKLTGAPSTAIITSTSDTENALGIVTSGAGTTGNATIAIIGQASCDFDNATTAGNYFIISTTTAGKCHDAGSAFPTSAAPYGRVLSTNGSSGTYNVTLMTPDVAFQNAGNGKSKPGGSDTQVQFNSSNTFAGDSDLTFTGGNTLNATNAAVTTSLTVAGAAITNNIVQNSQSAAYTTVLADAGKHIYHPSADTTARTWTIDSNANVAYPIGTAITFVNDCSAGVVTISTTSDTLVLAGTGTTGSRTLAACGIATAVKVTSTRWIINGTGLT